MLCYKSCGEYIVVLEKIDGTITNENRKENREINGAAIDVIRSENKKYAGFRANKLKVVDIYHKIRNKEHIGNTINTIWPEKLSYVVGKTTEEPNYDTNIQNISARGIHYYLSVEPAMYCEEEYLKKMKYTGKSITYEVNTGEKSSEGMWTNGEKSEQWTYFQGGSSRELRKSAEGTYSNGREESMWTLYHSSGEKSAEGNYLGGIREGTWTFWHQGAFNRDQKSEEGIYVDGKKKPGWKYWKRNGDPLYIEI